MSLSEKGVLVILSSPSGAGKTSIARALVEENKNFVVQKFPELPDSIKNLKQKKKNVYANSFNFFFINFFFH